MSWNDIPWIDVLGYAASIAVFATFCMSTMMPLRYAAIASNVIIRASRGPVQVRRKSLICGRNNFDGCQSAFHAACSSKSIRRSGASSIAMCPDSDSSKVRHELSALHSSSALSKAGAGYLGIRM